MRLVLLLSLVSCTDAQVATPDNVGAGASSAGSTAVGGGPSSIGSAGIAGSSPSSGGAPPVPGGSGGAASGGGGGGSGGQATDGCGNAGVAQVPSCSGLAVTCGQNDICCAAPVVPGGSFGLGEPAVSAASLTSFALDAYEVTVGRFRKFVDAYDGPPAGGAGKHPLIADSGWQSPAWDSALAPNAAELQVLIQCGEHQTWDTSGANDELPMNCLSWFEAFAFCAWDGGRLPTEAELEYAASGGSEERKYPWGSAEPNGTFAAYECNGDGNAADCSFSDILPVAAKPAGVGKYGHYDLAGAMYEWVLDWHVDYPQTCVDCANISVGTRRSHRGGSWRFGAELLSSAHRSSIEPTPHYNDIGVRCARAAP